MDETPDVGDLIDELEELRATVETEAAREQVDETIEVAMNISRPGVFGQVVRGFDRSDVAEALLGSVVFGVPMFVESGTLEVGEFVAGNPLYLLTTVGFAVVLVVGILYVADFQDVRITAPLFGFLPRRLVGVVATSAVTALFLMTVWGRVDWTDPWVATCQTAIAFVPMSIGAALGDILPGS
ncbi:MAG: DUF2391 domain-containing protein [Halobacteriaceae archaeon]